MTAEIVTADAFDALADMDAGSIHAVVTDPPYALGDGGFMGREWDNFSDSKTYQKWCEKWSEKCRRILKPGGHFLAFGGNTRHHRTFAGVEDAGFEVRDTLTWHYGSGFPKALDVAKAIDKSNDVDREVVGVETVDVGMQGGEMHAGRKQNVVEQAKTVATSDAAREWDGWKTSLKPATEFIVLARKPFDGTVAENVQEHGTGALNVDGCRISAEDEPQGSGTGFSEGLYGGGHNPDGYKAPEGGRYPANVIFDEAAAEALDRESDTTSGGTGHLDRHDEIDSHIFPGFNHGNVYYDDHDHGGPSRYFYVHGWDRFAVEMNTRLFYTSKATRAERTLDGKIENAHPTVKPLDLMEWLVRLVTAEGQVVLDPFCGTGTTLRAAKDLGRGFVGIERDPKWADVARARCGLTPDNPSSLAPEGQGTLADGGFTEAIDKRGDGS